MVASPAFAAFARRLDSRETKNPPRIRHSLRWQRTRERPCDAAVVLLLLVEVVVVVIASKGQEGKAAVVVDVAAGGWSAGTISHVRSLHAKAGSAGTTEIPVDLAFTAMAANTGDAS